MAKIILAINAGSSSVKISVYKVDEEQKVPMQIADVQVSGLTALPVKLDYTRGTKKIKGHEVKDIRSQEEAFQYILNQLVHDHGLSDLSKVGNITHTCHRVVHGGDYSAAHIIDSNTYHHLEDLTDLAPLHNKSALAIVEACMKILPDAKNIAFFDSAFHATIPEAIRTYCINPIVAKRNKLQKYGFHGISYAFIVRSVAEYLGKPQDQTSLIALHLGSGASACAIKNGKSLDNSMGLTPLAGLPGATRSGSVDPSLIFHYTHNAGKPSRSSAKEMHISTAEAILNIESGWKALTGMTDFGMISSSNSPMCKLAFDIFVDRIIEFVGSYFVKLEGHVDALVFAGGIGEKGVSLRAAVVEKCRCLGFELDAAKNKKSIESVVQEIGGEGAKYRTLVCRTDEQFEMARGCTANPELFD